MFRMSLVSVVALASLVGNLAAAPAQGPALQPRQVTVTLNPDPHGGMMMGCRFVPGPDGIRVLKVTPNLPGDQAGLRPGDVIVTVNGITPKDLADFAVLIDRSPGGVAELKVLSRAAPVPSTPPGPQVPRMPHADDLPPG
jgi:S1-C subfamily serine protease